MDNVWLVSALWLGLALAASLVSIWVGISVALIGALAGNTFGLNIAPWVNYLAGFGAILLTFLAGVLDDVFGYEDSADEKACEGSLHRSTCLSHFTAWSRSAGEKK